MKNQLDNLTHKEVISLLMKDRAIRREITRRSFYWFFCFYFAHYITYETAPFQREIMRLLEDDEIKLFCLVAFRGSGKSSIVTTAYVLWSILGRQERRFALILSQTKEKAQQHLMNVRRELEGNELLRADLGPFRDEQTPWGSQGLVFSALDAKIASGSVEQSIRGARHGAKRPDLVILDDIEDISSVRTREGRDKPWAWLTGEVIPAGDKRTRIVIVGNLLHEDSVMRRIERKIEAKEIPGAFRRFPLVSEDGQCLWRGKYPTMNDVEAERRRVMDEVTWLREFLLRIVPDAGQIVWPEWIKKWGALPKERPRYRVIGIDLASSQKESADYIAMVPASVYGFGEDMRIYVHSPLVNERMVFPVAVERAMTISRAVGSGERARLVIESNGYQAAFIQQLSAMGFEAEGITSTGDKAARLSMTTHLLQRGHILFPAHGAEELIEQIVGFGKEAHDDLADAFVFVVHHAMASNRQLARSGRR